MNEMMSSGVELMLVGMGIVYLFLALLVVAINTMTVLVTRYFPEVPTKFSPPAHKATESALIAAITAAVQQYRSPQK